MNIEAFCFTYPKNQAAAYATLSSFRDTDWPCIPRLIIQDRGAEPGWDASAKTYKATLEIALESGCDYALILEDDVRPNRHLRHNLERILDWPLQPEFLSLFMPDLIASPWESFHPEYGYRVARDFAIDGVRRPWDQYYIWGSQAYVASRHFIQELLKVWDTLPDAQDTRVFGMMHRLKIPFLYSMPCLVQHAPNTTAFSTPPCYAADFDPEFKL